MPRFAARLGLRRARVVSADAAGAVLVDLHPARRPGLPSGRSRGASNRSTTRPYRGTWGGCLLAAIAADPGAGPRTGDVVDVMRWPDGVVTVERVQRRCGDRD